MLLVFEPPAKIGAGSSRLIDLLADYLLTASDIEYHGAEGMTVEDVVCTGYRAAVDRGWVPGRVELIRRHPELMDEINAFFVQEKCCCKS